jgi:predicted transcriptional regulator
MAKSKNTAVSSKEKDVKRAKRQELQMQLNGHNLLGEVVCWNARSEKAHQYQDVLDALDKAKLDKEVAKKIMPRFAFTRACKELTDQAVIDVLKDSGDIIKFQFTKKFVKNEEWEYAKDCTLELNKRTGEITCKKKELQTQAQKLLDKSIQERTTSDITKIVQLLFEQNAEMFPLRDQGGVYFVPVEHTKFTVQVGNFLKEIGGSMNRFPVPAGTDVGDAAVQDAVATAILNLVKEHEQSIDLFSVNTRQDTMENAANKIKATRVKIEAYATYLQDRSSELVKAVDNANKKLKKTIEKLAEERSNMPTAPDELFGHTSSRILRWMGKNDWDWKDAKKVMESYGFRIQDTTYRGQLWCGTKEGQYGKVPDLTDKQITELEKKRKEKVKA